MHLTTDGLKAYLEAVEGAPSADIDYAQLVKLYGEPTGVTGAPDKAHISTSYVERQNFTMRAVYAIHQRLLE